MQAISLTVSMTDSKMLRVLFLLCGLLSSTHSLEDFELEEPYYDSYLVDFDLKEPSMNGSCSVDESTCVMTDNVIKIDPENTLEQCRTACKNEPRCKFLTFFGRNSLPFSEICVMFTSCDDMDTCSDCTTEDKECLPCSRSQVSKMGDIFLEFIPSVPEEFKCKSACMEQGSCTWYTYYRYNDPMVPRGCFLLSGVQEEPMEECETCMTGPINCSDWGKTTREGLDRGGYGEGGR